MISSSNRRYNVPLLFFMIRRQIHICHRVMFLNFLTSSLLHSLWIVSKFTTLWFLSHFSLIFSKRWIYELLYTCYQFITLVPLKVRWSVHWNVEFSLRLSFILRPCIKGNKSVYIANHTYRFCWQYAIMLVWKRD